MTGEKLRVVDGGWNPSDQPLPPSQAEIDLDREVGSILFHLTSAHGPETPAHLVAALRALGRHARSGSQRPSEADVDQMLGAARHARHSVTRFIDNAHTISANGCLGMDAVEALICLWGGAPETAAARHPHQVDDILDHATIFRREMQIAVTMQAIERRVSERRADLTATFWRGFDDAAAS